MRVKKVIPTRRRHAVNHTAYCREVDLHTNTFMYGNNKKGTSKARPRAGYYHRKGSAGTQASHEET